MERAGEGTPGDVGNPPGQQRLGKGTEGGGHRHWEGPCTPFPWELRGAHRSAVPCPCRQGGEQLDWGFRGDTSGKSSPLLRFRVELR